MAANLSVNYDIPTSFVIFGATGDLAHRKLLPSLYNLDKQGMLPAMFKVIAFARRQLSDSEYRMEIKQELQKNFSFNFNENSWFKFAQKITYQQGDFNHNDAYVSLAKKLNDTDMQLGVCTHKIFYLAVTPDLYEQVLKGIKQTQLQQICKNEKDTRIIMEKPYGRSLQNFRELNKLALELFSEDQIYRIDHLVGKETVQNILYFRAANPALLTSYDCNCIESVRINYYESLGVGGRSGYYDAYGHLKDMVQSHVLQLLALTLMDLPVEMSPNLISKAKIDIIKHLQITDLKSDVVRGQYTKGVIDGKNINGYREETGIPRNSQTETLVKIKTKMKGGKWDGLPVTLATGKGLSHRLTEVIIHFHEIERVKGVKGGNTLIIRIQPEEGIILKLKVKKPVSDTLENADMVFKYKDSFFTMLPEAYEKIILDIVRKIEAFDLTSAELEAAWEFIDPIAKLFKTNAVELKFYPAGSNELLED